MKPASKIILVVTLIAYLFILLNVTVFRSTITMFNNIFLAENNYITSVQTALEQANFKPFHAVHYYLISQQEPLKVGIANTLGNVLLFIPLGIFLPLLWMRFRSIKSVLLAISFTSLLIEITQLLTATGVFDVDDILLNTFGGVIGYAIFTTTANARQTEATKKL